MKYFFRKKKKRNNSRFKSNSYSLNTKFKIQVQGKPVSIVIYEVIPGDFTQSAPFHSASAS